MLSTNFQRLSWLIFSQKGNHTSLNEVKSSLQSFSEWLMLPHGTFPPSPQASPFLSPHRSPRPADPTDTPTGWGNLARQGRSTAGPEAWLWTSPRSVSVCSSLGTLFLGFFFSFPIFHSLQSPVMKYWYLMSFLLISLPGGDVTNAMASVFGRFYRGPRLPYHDFESQAFALHAHSFKAPLNFFWKTQKKSFCFFWLQKDKHKKYPCYFPPRLMVLLKYINLQYLICDLLHCLLYLRTYVLPALGTARVLRLHFKY